MTWQSSAAALWGDQWIAPMAEVCRINRRTIERWRAGDGEPNEVIQRDLARLALFPYARQIGDVLRRVANGETLDDVEADCSAIRHATNRVRVSLERYGPLAILASGPAD